MNARAVKLSAGRVTELGYCRMFHRVYEVDHIGAGVARYHEHVGAWMVGKPRYAHIHGPLVDDLSGIIPTEALDSVDSIRNPAPDEECIVLRIVREAALRILSPVAGCDLRDRLAC